MKKQVLIAAMLASAVAATPAVANTTINGTILADNGSIAVHQQGGSYTVIPGSVSGNWPTPRSFSYDIPDDVRSLRQCQIHVISWGDGSVAQGVMAHLSGNAGATFTGKPGSSLNTVRMSSVTHSGGTAAGLSVAGSNPGGIIQALGAPNTQFTSQPVVTGGIPGTWGPVNLPALMDGRSNVVFVWNETKAALNANPNNFRVVSAPCVTLVKAQEPVDPNIAVFECMEGYLMDMSNDSPGWSLRRPNGSVVPLNQVSNVAWSPVQNSRWVGPGGPVSANGVWTYSRKLRIDRCPQYGPAALTIAYRADNIGTLRVKDASGNVIASANQAGTPNYGFLPASLTNLSYVFPAGTGGTYTVELAVQNTSGPTGASMSVLVNR